MKSRRLIFFGLLLSLFLVGCQKEMFEIKFIDNDNTIIKVFELEKNSTIVAPTAPEKEGYEFIGWDKAFSKVTEDLVIVAKYEVKSYTLTFLGPKGEVLGVDTVKHGEDGIAPNPKVPGYDFIAWDTDFTNVKEDLIIQGGYKTVYVTVKFYGFKGVLLKEETIKYGESVIPPAIESGDTYTFTGWDKDYNNVKSNLDIYAKFNEDEFTIEYYDGTTKLNLGYNKYKASDEFALPTPTKEGFVFAGWFLSSISLYEINVITEKLRGDLKLYARWISESANVVVPDNATEFVKINKNLHSNGVSYVYQPEFPTGAPSTSVTAYTWSSSDTKVATISAYSSISVVSSGFAVIKGVYTLDPTKVYYAVIRTSPEGVVKSSLEEANQPNYVNVTFELDENTTITKVVKLGGFVIPPTANYKEGYSFAGWKNDDGAELFNITEELVFKPTYVSAEKTYAGKTISILGDSISTFLGYIPEHMAHFYPYATADFGDVNQTWWMQLINHHGLQLIANNSWGGSAVAGTAASATQNPTRLQYLFVGDIVPDIIVIHMGSNDAPSKYITLAEFDLAYKTMIDNIRLKAPNAEIYVCTLPPVSLYSTQEQEDYNSVILKYAGLMDLEVINLAEAFTLAEAKAYLLDSVHPNKAGMDRFAEIAINKFDQVLGVNPNQ